MRAISFIINSLALRHQTIKDHGKDSISKSMRMIDKYPPRKVINYPIPGDSKGGALYIYGDANSKNIALLSAGFPDDHSIFLPFASSLANGNGSTSTSTSTSTTTSTSAGALVGVTCLPGYDDREDKPWTEHKTNKSDGYSFNEIALAFNEASKALRSESTHTHSRPKFTGIFHDWAVIPGAIWANRALEDDSDNSNAHAPDELVYFDVLPGKHPDTKLEHKVKEIKNLSQTIAGIYYQLLCSASFLLQRYFGSVVGALTLILGCIPMMLITALGPLKQIDLSIFNANRPALNRMAYMCFPYFNTYNMVWKYGIKKAIKDPQCFGDATLPKDLTKMPVLYLYGTEKNTVWHSEVALKVLEREKTEKRSKSNAISVDDAGHYLYVQKAEFCLDCVKTFMQQEKK